MHIDRSTPVRIREMFPDLEDLQHATTEFNSQFAPGLLDSMNAATPPSLETIKSWRIQNLDLSGVWVVYVLLVQRPGDPIIYIYFGSTVATSGSTARLQTYLRIKPGDVSTVGSSVSSSIRALIADGGTITDILPIYAAERNSMFDDEYGCNIRRSLVISVEATLTTRFWTYKTEEYGSVTGLGVWDFNKTPACYSGLNTHSAFRDMGSITKTFQIQEEQEMMKETEANEQALQKSSRRYQFVSSVAAVEKYRASKRVGNLSADALEKQRASGRKENKTADELEKSRARHRNENMSADRLEKKRASNRIENMSADRVEKKRSKGRKENMTPEALAKKKARGARNRLAKKARKAAKQD